MLCVALQRVSPAFPMSHGLTVWPVTTKPWAFAEGKLTGKQVYIVCCFFQPSADNCIWRYLFTVWVEEGNFLQSALPPGPLLPADEIKLLKLTESCDHNTPTSISRGDWRLKGACWEEFDCDSHSPSLCQVLTSLYQTSCCEQTTKQMSAGEWAPYIGSRMFCVAQSSPRDSQTIWFPTLGPSQIAVIRG